jgi:DNA-binding CsgD family transcriptional regulator
MDGLDRARGRDDSVAVPPTRGALEERLLALIDALRQQSGLRPAADILRAAAAAAGLTHVAVVADVSHPDALRDEEGESLVARLGWPGPFIDEWLARGYSVGSPGMVAARLRHLPFAWPVTEIPDGLALPLGAAGTSVLGGLGITGGVLVPVRLPRGRFAMVSWYGPIDRDAAQALVEAVGPQFLLLAHYFLELVREKADPPAVREDLARMTPRELECLTLIAKGASDAEAGQTLGLSERTVRFHLGNATEKLGARTRSHAVALATQLGILGSVF